jgi:hypothetical protein
VRDGANDGWTVPRGEVMRNGESQGRSREGMYYVRDREYERYNFEGCGA